MTNNILEITKIVKKRGFASVANFLTEDSLRFLEKKLKNNIVKGNKSSFPIFFKQYLIKLFKLDLKIIFNSFYLQKIADKLNLKNIAENILNHEAELHMIDCYYNEQSSEDIIPWHNDIGPKNLNENNFYFYEEAEATINNKKKSISARGIKFFFI